ncbi:hypothetical protein [Cellulomonas dongxiuzhuiae]|uniref:DUF3592 domain-containing protein n=1 Tax=Cellulomonas dongxiuzhuiae TaxID=2819979 RepID=A0ABX8GIT0_9CELL|nr:hypothetical protein [Cellulomonas dongxiuzhuiae]MBO3094748.1 hypothetical protein [Cellulomonas dongxiuzhuiae]QWC15748.1 hypothetical protein KKR89_15950 [Cellulomonas dongxiuzhuiae]
MRADPPPGESLEPAPDGPEVDPDGPVQRPLDDVRHPRLDRGDEATRDLGAGPPTPDAGWRELVPLWVGGLGLLGLGALVVTLVRLWTDAAWFEELADVAVLTLLTGGLGALLRETWTWHRAGVVRVPPPARGTRPVPTWPADALRRARRRGRRGALRRTFPWLVVLLLAAAAVAGHRASEHDAWLLRTQPVLTATVVEVRPPLTARGEADVVVEVDGRRARLALSYPEIDDAAPGATVAVVVDPEDPAHVLATTSHDDWAYAWWAEVLLWVMLTPVCVVLARWRMPQRAAVRAARTASLTHPARVLVVGTRWATLDVGGERWVFSGQAPAGEHVVLMGEPRDGSWVVLDDGRTRLPDEPLRAPWGDEDEGDEGERDEAEQGDPAS